MIKTKHINNIYLTFVILFSGLATTFYRSQSGLIVLFLIGFIFFHKTSLRPTKSLLYALTVWFGYFLINTFIINSFHSYFMITYFIMIIIAWWLISYYKANIFKSFEDIIYILTIISLFFWIWQLISPNSLNYLITMFNVSGDDVSSKSIIVYTYHYHFNPGEIPRNAGFTWEPGPFASFIGLAMFFNIARNNVKIKDKKRLFIFLIALITTQSTTGFLLLLAILLWYAWAHYKSKVLKIISIPLAVSVVVLIFYNVPWLQEKIQIDREQSIDNIISHAELTGKSYNPGRLVGFQLRWEDFKRYPIAGYGGNISLQHGYIDESNVVYSVSGLGNIFGKYGIIGALIFITLIIKTGKQLALSYSFRAWIIFPLLLLIIGFAFNIIETPIIVIFWLFPIFYKKTNTLKHNI